MSEITATRTRRFWAIGLAAAAWLVAAALLWRTSVPGDVELPELRPGEAFPGADLARRERYESGLRANWVAATAVHLAVLAAAAFYAGRARLRGIRGGVILGVATLAVVWLAGLPFVLFAHWWRRRYGVSEAGYDRILLDPWLERLGSLAVAAAAIALFMLLARRVGERWWLVGGPLFVVVAAAYLVAQPLLFAPRVEPLADRVLVREIQQLAREQGVGEVDVDVRDASRRTRALNAEFYGVGPTRRVVIWDTSLQRLTRPELRALVSHELGHVQAHHVWKSVGWLALFAVPGAWVVARATRRRGGLCEPAAVPLALLVLFVLELALLPAVNAISRRYEQEADWLALQATGEPAAFESLTRQLSAASLADVDPPRWASVVLETHPSPLDRIRLARSLGAGALPEGS